MEGNLVFITCQPSDLSFAWEIELQLLNFRKYNYSSISQVLIYVQKESDLIYWNKLKEKFSEVSFFFFRDLNLKKITELYIPVIRPYCLKQHFENYPELEDKVIFYCDSDIIFTKYFNFTPYLEGNTIYASNVNSYNGITYLDSKIKDVLPFKREQYKKIDIVEKITNISGINRDQFTEVGLMGGCQYILKNIDTTFWSKVEEDCIKIRFFLTTLNREYFSSENSGIQSWCADLWALWFNLIKRGAKLGCPYDLNFSWASSKIADWDKNYIYHNAGISKTYLDKEETIKVFNKSDVRFKNNLITPFDITDWGEISKDYCNYNYLQEILKIKNPVCKVDGIIHY